MKKILFFLALVLTMLFSAKTGFCDGFIIPEWPRQIINPPTPRPQALSVKYHHVETIIENRVAITKIDQVFLNHNDRDIEGLYIFPLPEDSAINQFSMYVDGKEMKGEMLDKERARQIYEDIVRTKRDPALLEYLGRNLFQVRIFPIPARGEKRIKLEYTEVLKTDNNTTMYRYSLNTEKFSLNPLEEVSVSVKIKSDTNIKTVYSPSHADKVSVTRKGENSITAGYEEKNVRPDKDFILYYTTAKSDFSINILANRADKNNNGYFMLFVAPPSLNIEAMPKDIVFVFDVSGSMAGEKIDQAKKALAFCVNSLNAGDRFNIISFSTDYNSFKPALADFNGASKKEALDFIAALRANGSTNINDSLLNAVSMFSGDKPKFIVFATDGLPTAGEADPKTIARNVSNAAGKNIRLFSFGVGYDVNTILLDKLSQDCNGVSEYVRPEDNFEEKVSSFFSKISNPVLSDLTLSVEGVKITEILPKKLPDLFAGTQLMVTGRYTGNGSAVIKVTGNTAGKPITIVNECNFPEYFSGNEFIPRLWATRRVGYLLEQVRLNGENKEVVDEIKDLGKKFGIMTPYTSFLVLDSDAEYDRWGITPGPAGLSADKKDQLASKSMAAESGRGAVNMAKKVRMLKEEESGEQSMIRDSKVKAIGSKTFYLDNNIWTDSEYKAGTKTVVIKQYSAEYFDLLKSKPELAKYFGAGEKVIVVLDGTAYQVE